MKRAVPAAFLLLVSGPAFAQAAPGSVSDSGLDLSGSMRLRYETIDGQARTGFNAGDDLLNLRTILTAQYRTGPVRLVAELYDSRAWLADRRTPVTANEVNALELVQGYVAVDAPGTFGDGTSLSPQGGRFLLNIGSRRLVAADDYRNTTNGYTGIRADIAGRGGLRATFLYVLPQLRLPDDLDSLLDNKPRIDRESFDQMLWGATVSRPATIGGATAELSFYHLGERDAPGRPTRDRSLDTVSGRIVRDSKPGAFDYEAEAIYQFGHVSGSLAATAPRLDVGASFFFSTPISAIPSRAGGSRASRSSSIARAAMRQAVPTVGSTPCSACAAPSWRRPDSTTRSAAPISPRRGFAWRRVRARRSTGSSATA